MVDVKQLPVRAEPRSIPGEHAALLAEVAGRIRPDQEDLAAWCARYAKQHAARLATDLWLLAEYAEPGAKVLEYGAVPLLMTGALAERGYDLQALDVAPRRFAGAIEAMGLAVTQCDVETEAVPFADGSFDVVLFNELFEHLRIDPIFTLREARRVLRPGGLLMLSTPNLRSFRGLLNLVWRNQAHAASADVYRQYEKLRTLGHMGHVREYTTREVVDFLAHTGFDAERLVFRGGHGRGVVGFAERLWPSMRPFFSVLARARAEPSGA